MSRSQRRLLAVLHLVRVLQDEIRRDADPDECETISIVEGAVETPVDPAALGRSLARVDRLRVHAARRLPDRDGWTKKQGKAWDKTLEDLQAAVLERCGEEMAAKLFAAAVLEIVVETADQVPTNDVDRKILWNDLAHEVNALYELFDPELSYRGIDQAAELGRELRKVLG